MNWGDVLDGERGQYYIRITGGAEVKKENGKEKRRSYQKPNVEQIKLVAEEQVLGICKTATTGGGIGVADGECFFPANCVENGT